MSFNINAKLTSYTPLTGADGQGRPTFGTESLAAPVSCTFGQPSRRQVETAEREGLAVDGVIVLQSLIGISVGDRLQCDHPDVVGQVLQVTRRSTVKIFGAFRRELFVRVVEAAP